MRKHITHGSMKHEVEGIFSSNLYVYVVHISTCILIICKLLI